MDYIIRDRETDKMKVITAKNEEEALKIALEIYEDPYIYDIL